MDGKQRRNKQFLFFVNELTSSTLFRDLNLMMKIIHTRLKEP